MKTPLLVALLGVSAGASAALVLGPFMMGLGAALAAPVLAVFVAIAHRRAPGDALVLRTLVFGAGFVVAFLGVTIPATLGAPLEPEETQTLALRWTLFGASAPLLLVARLRR